MRLACKICGKLEAMDGPTHFWQPNLLGYVCRDCRDAVSCHSRAGVVEYPAAPKGDGYDSLRSVLAEAVEQASDGKGKERHANAGEAFDDQQIVQLGEWMGSDHFEIGQACKKAIESTRLPRDRARKELLGAVNYLAAAVLVLDELAKREDQARQAALLCDVVKSPGTGPRVSCSLCGADDTTQVFVRGSGTWRCQDNAVCKVRHDSATGAKAVVECALCYASGVDLEFSKRGEGDNGSWRCRDGVLCSARRAGRDY